MVAIINHSKSIRSVLLYNENKVKDDKATLILANKFLCELGDLNMRNKLNRFDYINRLNPRVRTNTLHISLNFDPSEYLKTGEMQAVALAYMDKIGFSDQPFLVYEHRDAGHPHLHIVTTLVRPDGSRINTHNIGRFRSEPARKEIENIFGLVRAEEKRSARLVSGEPGIKKVVYGQEVTKHAINRVVSNVIGSYKFATLSELNAILGLYNVLADTGSQGSYLRDVRGLQYRLLDESGEKVGVPLKASSLAGRPTLKKLQKLFKINETLRMGDKVQVKAVLDRVLNSRSDLTMAKLKAALLSEGIDVRISRNAQGLIFGLTFIDHNTRCVFKGSEIGKEYAAKAILSRITVAGSASGDHKILTVTSGDLPDADSLQMLRSMLSNEGGAEGLPYELSGKKRKRRKRKI